MTNESHAKSTAQATLEGIKDLVFRIQHAHECDGDREHCELDDETIRNGLGYPPSREVTDEDFADYHDADMALDAILEGPLSVEVRSRWYVPDEGDDRPYEYRIVLATGGPAVQIIGKLGEDREPITAELQYQDWFTDWQKLPITGDDEEVLLEYARRFYYGE